MKVEIEAGWQRDPVTRALMYFEHQWVEQDDLISGKQPKPTIVIDLRRMHLLLDWVKDNIEDIVKTDRTEDLKIIHRLIDVMERRKIG